MNKIGAEIMAKFDRLISEFGNTAEILQAASKDLAADNAAAARADYGRCECDLCKSKALKEQIERLINCGYKLADAVQQNNGNLHHWAYEVELARELIK